MNKVLVTGLSLGKGFDTCQACSFDMEWLLRYPSVLLWADRILVPESIWEIVSKGIYPYEKEQPELSKCVKLIFDITMSEDIIEIIKPETIINQSLSEDISEQIEKDRIQLSSLFSDIISIGDDEKVPGQIFINGSEYCFPHMWTIYASLILSRAFDAHCLFNENALNICKYKFGLSSFPSKAEIGRIESFHSIFQAYLPNDSLFPEYLITNKELCAKCAHESTCKDTYLATLETNLKTLLSWRNYDEILQLKSVVSDIVDKRSKAGGIIDHNIIRQDFQDTQNKLRRRMNLTFPKVKRWSNITTVLSIPVALAGVATSVPLITVAGLSLSGLAQASKQVVEFLSNKYSWIGFINRDTKLHTE